MSDMSDNDKRRCDGCAYGGRSCRSGGAGHLVTCHHASIIAGDDNLVAADWWCNHYWPLAVPLPTPWLDVCPHGSRAFCMTCLCDTIHDGLHDGLRR